VDKDHDAVISSLIDVLKIDGSRDNACAVFEALAFQSSDPAATKRLLASLSDLFSKKGVFPPHQRLAHACALSSVILRKPAGISKHAAEIAPIIAAAAARENNDDVLAAMLALCVQVSAYAGFFEDASAKAIKSAMLHISAAVRQSLWRALLQCSEKYSAAPNFNAKAVKGRAKAANIKVPMVPAKKELNADAIKAGPARPLRAIW
jgi:alkylhydroperoxidase/carboxymuconolactone decarboxylase family protein YurZ